MSGSTRRRTFVKHIGLAGLTLPSTLPRLVRAASANDTVRHASVGGAGRPWVDVRNFAKAKGFDLVAVCDVDARRVSGPKKMFEKARVYQDWRRLLEKEATAIDSVNVGTPDHMHAPITMAALEEGKAVYCQKPLTHDVHESRQLRRAADRTGLPTQMGIQNHSRVEYRMAVGALRAGVLGKIRRVHLWSNKPPRKYRPTGPRPPGNDALPSSLAWDLWLGTAPSRPFVAGVYHPDWWRGWRAFGGGWLGDMGCHIFDPMYEGLSLTSPRWVRAEVEKAWTKDPARFTEVYPQWQIVDYEFPPTDRTAGPLRVTWSDGGRYPPEEAKQLLGGQDFPQEGGLYIGDRGAMLLPHVGGPQLLPREKFRDADWPSEEGTNHMVQFIDAVRGRDEPSAPFRYSAPLAEAVLLGTVAVRVPGRTLQWNADDLSIPNVPIANRHLRRTYRDGWHFGGLG